MIPLREQEFIRDMFQESLTGPVKLELFTQRRAPVFIPGREECQFCDEVQQILEELTHLSDKISLRVHDLAKAAGEAKRYGIERVPATVVRGVLNRPLVFYGMPGGTLFPVLIEACVAVSVGVSGTAPALKRRLKRIKRDLPVRLFTTMEDSDGADMARQVAGIALESGRVHLAVIESGEFPALVEQIGVQSVPLTVIDGRVRLEGYLSTDETLDQIVHAAETTATSAPARVTGSGLILDPPKPDEIQRGETRPSGLIIPGR
jgi:alkyl hydroperoxide reductase subunit AhpF